MDQARTSCVQKTRPPWPLAKAFRPPSLRAQQPGGTRHASLDRNPHPAQGPQAPAGHVAGAMDARCRPICKRRTGRLCASAPTASMCATPI